MEVQPLNDEKPNIARIKTDISTKYSPVQGWFAKRYLLAGSLCMGMFCLSCLCLNTSLAIIEMTKNRTIQINETTVYYGPEFDWNSKTVGLILSAYSYGHLSSFLVALVVKKFGGVRTNGCALFLSGVINVLYPFIIRYNFYFFLFMRVVEGILGNLVYLSTFEIWSKWGPKADRSKLLSIQSTGCYIAYAAVFPIGGYLAHIWQWPSTYYFAGGISILISSIILLSFSNEPSTDSYISQKERKYLMHELEKSSQQKVNYPWRKIFTSIPIWVSFVMKFSYICVLAFIDICLPLYVKDMTNVEIDDVGILSGIPNVLGIFALPLFGWLADYIQNKNILNATQVHKTYTFFGMILGAGCLFIIALVKNANFTINIILLILLKLLLSLTDLVSNYLPLFLAPNHSSLIAAMISYSYFFGTTFVPILMGYVVTTHDPYQWSTFLSTLAVIQLVGGFIFIFFGSSEAQSWSKKENLTDDEQNPENLMR